MSITPRESLIAIGFLLALFLIIWAIISIKKKDEDEFVSPPLPDGDVLPILKSSDRLLINEICMLLESNGTKYFVQNMDSSGIFPGPFIIALNDMILFVSDKDVKTATELLKVFFDERSMEIGAAPDETFSGHPISGEIIAGGKGRTYLIDPKPKKTD